MNKNRKCASLISKSVAAAAISSVLVGSLSYAVTTDTAVYESESHGALAGVMAATVQIHEDIIEKQNTQEPEPNDSAKDEVDEASEWSDKLMADVSDYLNIRNEPSKSAKVVGRLRPSDVATIISEEGEWIHITSGEVEGYVSAAYCLTGLDAMENAQDFCKTYALCNTEKLNIRSEADLDADIIGTLHQNQVIEVADYPEAGDWVSVVFGGSIGYLSSEYVSLETGELGTAMTPQEIEAAEIAAAEAKKAQRLAAAAAVAANQQQASAPEINYNPSVSASTDDETLLAALLMCEAGSSYEGMLAVGGVVMNRLHSGYAGTIRDVIFQRGQFTPAGSGKVDRTIANGVSETALQAARDAISGVDITGGCKSFRAASSGHSGINIGGNVFF